MRLRFRKPVAISFVCALGAFGDAPTFAQQQGAGVALKAHVSPAFSLSVSSHKSTFRFETADNRTSVLRTMVERAGLSEAIITLIGSGLSPASRVSIPFEIRTNAPYEMRIERLSVEGCGPQLAASIDSIRPGGVAVANHAAGDSKRRKPVDLSSLNSATAILSGPRVSTAGSLTSPANALLVNLTFDVDGQSRECEWQTTLRLSLKQSSH